MPVSQNDKDAVLAELENARTKGNRLVIRLKFAGRTAEAAQALQKVKSLGAQIDALLAKAMLEWAGNAKALVDELKKTNTYLQRDLTDIKNKKDVANRVIHALGKLDEVVQKAGALAQGI